MNTKTLKLLAALSLLAFGMSANAAVISFTGGTVQRLNATTETTNNSVVWEHVDYYDEDGFRLDFLDNFGSQGPATHIGDYYNAGNDVIHAHWASGHFGAVTEVEITKIGGGRFDFESFILTSNTALGGGAATGLEEAWVQGFVGGVATGGPVLLAPEDWGFPATQMFLGAEFNNVDMVRFFISNAVDCFGLDEFVANQSVPEPAPLALLGLASAGMLLTRRRS